MDLVFIFAKPVSVKLFTQDAGHLSPHIVQKFEEFEDGKITYINYMAPGSVE